MGKNKKLKSIKVKCKFLFIIFFALLTALLLNTFVVSNTRIIGKSMSPLLNENDWVIVNRLAFLNCDPTFGDVVILKKPDLTNETIIKRIVGTPLDTIEIKNGRLYLNGNLVENDFAKMDEKENMSIITVPKNCYFVMGDNTSESNDSRKWTNPFVKNNEITGKVIFKYFPKPRIIK